MNTSILRRCWMRRLTRLGGVACLVLALGAAASPSSGSGPVTSLPGGLLGVSALSGSNAWAVGSTGTATLILHWNGTAWTRVAAPSPGHLGRLTAVSAFSPSNVWAVGSYETANGGNKTLILHWNGTSWVQVASPSPEVIDGSFLLGVSAVSPSDIWAAGWYYLTGGEASNTLVLHWNGTRWTRVPSPNPVHLGFNALNSVSGRSAADAWAVGSTDTGTLILHWDGTSWTRVPSPGQTSQDALNGVSALSASDAWSAGRRYDWGAGLALERHQLDAGAESGSRHFGRRSQRREHPVALRRLGGRVLLRQQRRDEDPGAALERRQLD